MKVENVENKRVLAVAANDQDQPGTAQNLPQQETVLRDSAASDCYANLPLEPGFYFAQSSKVYDLQRERLDIVLIDGTAPYLRCRMYCVDMTGSASVNSWEKFTKVDLPELLPNQTCRSIG